jgi:peptide chain release factor 1
VTDHRINLTLYRLDEMMDGACQMIIDPLVQEYQAELLAGLDTGV